MSSRMDQGQAPSEGLHSRLHAVLEQLVQLWARDAALLGGGPRSAQLMAHAAEAVEFALQDRERAHDLHVLAAGQRGADPRAWAGLRRGDRRRQDSAALAARYEDQWQATSGEETGVLAALGLAQCLLRNGAPADRVRTLLQEVERQVHLCASPQDTSLLDLWSSLAEDACLIAGQGDEALRLREERLQRATLHPQDGGTWLVPLLACQTAVFADTLGWRDRALQRYEQVLQTERLEDAVRPWLQHAWRGRDWAQAASWHGRLADDAGEGPALSRHALMAGRLALAAGQGPGEWVPRLHQATQDRAHGPLAATLLRHFGPAARHGLGAEAWLDVVACSLDFASDAVERADILTEVARGFDDELQLPEAATEYAEEALAEVADHAPARRLLARLQARRGMWGQLARLHEEEREAETDPQERLRLHRRLADLYLHELHDTVQAERHLRELLAAGMDINAFWRLQRLLAEQGRWDELSDLLEAQVERLECVEERIAAWEWQAHLQETRLRDPERALETMKQVAACRGGGLSWMRTQLRLCWSLRRWDAVAGLCESLAREGTRHLTQRVAWFCLAADVVRRQLGQPAKAEALYRRALEDDPLCEEALHGLGLVLHAQQRWQALADQVEQELAAVSAPSRRARCLLQQAEVQERWLNRPDEALRCWQQLESLGERWAPLARVRQQRLYWMAGRGDQVVRVLQRRLHQTRESGARARLSYLIADQLEWSMDQGREAWTHYAASLEDGVCAGPALEALDRLWEVAAPDDRTARLLLTPLDPWCQGKDDVVRQRALCLVAERMVPHDELAAREAWAALADGWPDHPFYGERWALALLQQGEVGRAELVRARCAATAVDLVRASWSAMDRGDTVMPSGDMLRVAMPAACVFLDRESGHPGPGFEGAAERSLFRQIALRRVGLEHLAEGAEDETRARLAWLVLRQSKDPRPRFQWGEWLARALPEPPRALRAWLDLVADPDADGALQAQWLREAASLGCWGHPLREDLYRAFEEANDLEGLQWALQQHLDQSPPEPVGAARLSLRRALCLEALGRQEDAIRALRHATIHAPDLADVALHRSRLEAQLERWDDACATLEDALQAGTDVPGRLDVLGRLADLHTREGADADRALRALQEAFDLSSGQKAWGLRLAQAHADFGSAAQAVAVFQEVLPTPPRDEDLHHWGTLVRLLAGPLDRRTEAEATLWLIFELYPERRLALTQLEDYYRRVGGARAFADRLGEWLSRHPERASRTRTAELWLYVGELHLSVLRAWPEAERAFAQARAFGQDQARTWLREGKAVARQQGRSRDAAALLLRALERADDDQTLWQEVLTELDAVWADPPEPGRLRMVRQLRRAWGESVELVDSSPRRDPVRPLEPAAAWEFLCADLADVSARDVITAAAPLAERVFARHAPGRRRWSGRRARGEDFTLFEDALQAASAMLGVAPPRVTAGMDGGRGAHALEGRAFWVEALRIVDAHEEAARFWAGWVAGVHFAGWHPWTWVDGDSARDLLWAVGVRALQMQAPHPLGSLPDDVGGLMVTPLRRAAAAALRDAVDVVQRPDLDAGSWARSFGDRVGLLMCADLTVALEEIAHQTGPADRTEDPTWTAGPEGWLEQDRGRGLAQWALGERHMALRHEVGLGPRPRPTVVD